MRLRPVVAIALLLLPAAVHAQRRLPRLTPRGPGRAVPLPPQPGVIARELAYKRLRVSMESYPLVSHFESPDYNNGGSASWTAFGGGMRMDYRAFRHMSATL